MSRRLVIFVGPHKSASSTVQEFFVQYATGRPKYRKVKALIGWRWPLLPSSAIPARKQWARLVYPQSDLRPLLQKALQKTVAEFPNVVVGSEEFDRFGKTPWSHRDGIRAVQQLIDWATTNSTTQVDVVINYRTPRQAQWISIWKQLMSLEENLHNRESTTYREWICQNHSEHDDDYDKKVWEYLDCVANPLGLTVAFLQALSQNTHVTLIDMGGVARRNLDIAHVSACHVLGLPCKDGWVRGINRTLVVNPKSRPLEGVTPRQLEELEWLLQQRDCTYRKTLQDFEHQKRLSIVYPENLTWKHCREETTINFRNTTYLLYAMQSQFGCQSNHTAPINVTQSMVEPLLNRHSVRNVRQDWIWIQFLQWTIIGILCAGLWQIRTRRQRRKSRRFVKQSSQ